MKETKVLAFSTKRIKSTESIKEPKEPRSTVVLFPPMTNKHSEEKKVDYDSYRSAAFDWIVSIIEYRGGTNDTLKLNNLRDLVFNYANHISMFERDGIAYMRVFWPSSGKSLIYEIEGFDKLIKNSPELTRLLLMNGNYAFLNAEDPDRCKLVFKTT